MSNLEITEDDILFIKAKDKMLPNLSEIAEQRIKADKLVAETNEIIKTLNQIINKPND